MKPLMFFTLLVMGVSCREYCEEYFDPGSLLCSSLELKPDEPVNNNNSIFHLIVRRVTGSIGFETLSSMTRLQYLMIEKSNISAVEDGALCSPPNLERLYLSSNQEFPPLTQSLFKNCDRLKELEIGNMEFGDTVFHGLPSLETLSFEAVRIESFKKQILEPLAQLKYLKFKGCGIKEFESGSLCISPRLQLIKISHNRYLPPLDKGLFENCDHVSSFIYQENEISDLQEGVFHGFVNLEQAEISNLRINRLTKGHLKGLNNLKYLSIDNCNIITIDDDAFEDLVKVETLTLRKNNLTEVDSAAFGRLTNLVTLDLISNNIESTESLYGFEHPNLQNLDLSGNRISNINQTILNYNLPNLKTIYDVPRPDIPREQGSQNDSYIQEFSFGYQPKT